MGEMKLGKIIAIDDNGNEIELGKGAVSVVETGIDETVEDTISRATMENGGTLSVDFKYKKITKRKMIKLFMSKGVDRNTAINLYKIYINTIHKRSNSGLIVFMSALNTRDMKIGGNYEL